MASIKIRVGASRDRSVDVVIADIEKRARKAGQIIAKSMSGGGTNRGPYRTAADSAIREHRRVTTAAERAAREQERIAARAAREQERIQRRSLQAQARGFKQLADVAAREMARAYRQREREGRQRREIFARRTSYGAMRGARVLGGFGVRAASDIARGAGVDFSLSAGVGRAVELDKAATRLSNNAYIRGAEGQAGQRQDPSVLSAEARGIAERMQGTTTAGEVLAGQEAFVAKTGDLETARAVTEDLAKLSAAFGANLEDVVDAAGDVSSVLGDVPNKAERVKGIMKDTAAMGKLGAVEMKDFATQMAKIASAAPSFEGDAGENIRKLTALTQFARAKGGAASATQAATATAAFANTLKTPARVNAFKAEGIDVMNARGQLRDPMRLIEESLAKTGGDPVRLKKLFANVVGGRGVEALANTYRGAGGGDKGIEAVRASWKQMLDDAKIGDKELADSVKAAQSTDAAKAQRFQNELDKVVSSLASKVLPEMEKLAPAALKLAESLGKATAWAAANPGKAITAAIVASIGQAALGATVRAAIESMIRGGGGAGRTPGLLPGGAGGGPANVAPLAAALVGTALATDQAAKLARETGSKANLSDVLPGFKDGKFSSDTFIEDFNPVTRVKKAGNAIGQMGRDVFRFDENLNAAARLDFKQREADGSSADVERAVTGLGTKLDALNSKLGGTINVRVSEPLTVSPLGRQPNTPGFGVLR